MHVRLLEQGLARGKCKFFLKKRKMAQKDVWHCVRDNIEFQRQRDCVWLVRLRKMPQKEAES